jgi:hypothetical protein
VRLDNMGRGFRESLGVPLMQPVGVESSQTYARLVHSVQQPQSLITHLVPRESLLCARGWALKLCEPSPDCYPAYYTW